MSIAPAICSVCPAFRRASASCCWRPWPQAKRLWPRAPRPSPKLCRTGCWWNPRAQRRWLRRLRSLTNRPRSGRNWAGQARNGGNSATRRAWRGCFWKRSAEWLLDYQRDVERKLLGGSVAAGHGNHAAAIDHDVVVGLGDVRLREPLGRESQVEFHAPRLIELDGFGLDGLHPLHGVVQNHPPGAVRCLLKDPHIAAVVAGDLELEKSAGRDGACGGSVGLDEVAAASLPQNAILNAQVTGRRGGGRLG